MIKTTIESIDPTNRPVVPDDALRRRVERAAALLETELDPIKTFPIDSRWKIVHQPGAEPRVELDLTGYGAGVRDWVFDTRDWGDDSRIVRSLRSPLWEFGSALSFHLREGLDLIRRDIQKLALVNNGSEG